MYGVAICCIAICMLLAQPRSCPTRIARIVDERTSSSFVIRQTENGQSGQNLRKKNANGRHASKNASQLETTTETSELKSPRSFMRETSAPTHSVPKDSTSVARDSLARLDVHRATARRCL